MQDSFYDEEYSVCPLLHRLRIERNKSDYSKSYVSRNLNAREKDSKEILKKVEELNKNLLIKCFK